MLQHSCKLSVDVPMDGYPGTFEAFLRTTDGKEFKEITTSEESGVCINFVLILFNIKITNWASAQENLSSGFLTKRDSSQSPQIQKLARN